MTTQRRTATQRREAILGSRWVRTVSCYRITTAYLLVAFIVLILLLTL